MFSGQYQYRLDNKGRVPLPPRFRERFKSGVVLARGVAACVELHPRDQWDDSTRAAFPPGLSPEQTKSLSRYVYSTAQETDMDAAGRIIVPPAFREYAGLGDDVTVVGAGNYLELWDLGAWERGQGSLEQEAKRLMGREARE